MTRRTITLATTPEDHRIAQLAAAAVGLSLIDAAIPLPLPGIKPGLANIVTMIVLARYGWRTAVWVSGLRVIAGGLLLGQFLSPGFFLSLAGAVGSLLVLAFACRLPKRWFGPVSWSIVAAFAHIGSQLLLARLWLIPHNGLFYMAPFFFVAALGFGIINGLIAARLIAESPSGDAPPAAPSSAPPVSPAAAIVADCAAAGSDSASASASAVPAASSVTISPLPADSGAAHV